MSKIKLIVGLCNPGNEYANTRHNAGKWVLDELARRYQCTLKSEPKFFGLTGEINIKGERVRLLAPQTYMNLSGKAVQALANFYNISPQEILVIHDELALEPGVTRLKLSGGHAGHNGLRDIMRVYGPDFWRLRVGIGHPGDKNAVSGYVLGKPAPQHQAALDQAITNSADAIEQIYSIGLEKVMTEFNKKAK